MEIDAGSSAIEMLRAMRAGTVSAVELLDLHLHRIRRYNSDLRSVTEINEGACSDAAAADRARARGEDALLLGLPLTIKSCIYVRGMSRAGCAPGCLGGHDVEDAPSTARIRRVGAVIMAKTNAPAYATDWQTWNEEFGRSVNPWDRERTPGGSTGGGAAAVAAGLTPLEYGGDFCGSIRIPAAFCGIYGHKSSLSALSGTGHFPVGLAPNAASAVAVIGPLARTAGDLEVGFDAAAGPEVGEEPGWRLHVPAPRHRRLSDFRVAVMPIPSWLPVDPEIVEAQEALVRHLQARGARVERVQPEGFGDVRDFYTSYLGLIGAISMARSPAEERREMTEMFRATGDELLMAYGGGAEAGAGDLLGWHASRQQYAASYRAFFRQWDVMLTPANITLPFHHTDAPELERILDLKGNRAAYYLQSFYPGLANFTGLPATAFPVGISAGGLPIGLQAIGPYLEDRTPMRFAGLVGEGYGGYVPPPGMDMDFP